MFLMRCLFTMFAEDVELLPKGSLQATCWRDARQTPRTFSACVGQFWEAMDIGGLRLRASNAK